ncbi:MAG: CAAX prenyl protease-related protein [Planctomycetota bacterium]
MPDPEIASPIGGDSAAPAQAPLPAGWLADHPWITFLLPFLLFMVATSFEPTPPPQFEGDETGQESTLADETPEPFFDPNGEGMFPINYSYYPQVYTAKIALVLLAMALVWPGYRTFPLRVSVLSVVVGVVGVVFWIVLCHLRLEPKLVGPVDRFLGSIVNMLPGLEGNENPSIGLMSMLGTGERSAFNPLERMSSNPLAAWTFLGVRFIGLALIVPVIEEFFLRGFIMRYLVHEKWWQVPFGAVNRTALIAGTAVPMLMHPAELLASLVWFSMVTWLMLRTRSIWDCVVAHVVTNFLLGVYVVAFDQWQLM